MTYREDDQSQAVERRGKADADAGESCTNTTTVSLDGGGEVSSNYT